MDIIKTLKINPDADLSILEKIGFEHLPAIEKYQWFKSWKGAREEGAWVCIEIYYEDDNQIVYFDYKNLYMLRDEFLCKLFELFTCGVIVGIGENIGVIVGVDYESKSPKIS